jgi:hypothetical protein
VHPALAAARCRAQYPAYEIAGIRNQVAPGLGDHLHLVRERLQTLVHHPADDLDGRNRLHVPDRVAAADIEQPRLEPGLLHEVKQRPRFFKRDAPVLRVAALGADMERHACQIRSEARSKRHYLLRVGGTGAELAGQGPVAADVGGGNAQVQLRVALDLEHAPQLIGAVDDEPLDALPARVGDRIPRLDGVRVKDLRSRNAKPQQQIELGGRRDLEPAALLGEHLEHAPVGIRLHRVVRPHPRHGRAEAAHLAAHDGGVDDQERSGVLLAGSLAHDVEVEADFGVRVEELLVGLLPGYCGLPATSDAARRAVAHLRVSQKVAGMNLSLRNVAYANCVSHVEPSSKKPRPIIGMTPRESRA